jgi:hypothetical protein
LENIIFNCRNEYKRAGGSADFKEAEKFVAEFYYKETKWKIGELFEFDRNEKFIANKRKKGVIRRIRRVRKLIGIKIENSSRDS